MSHTDYDVVVVGAGGDGGVGPTARIYHDAGEFVDGDYDTSGYEEPFDTSGEPPDDGGPGGTTGEARRPEDAVEEVREGVDEDLLAEARAVSPLPRRSRARRRPAGRRWCRTAPRSRRCRNRCR